jgi:hypothetical protein
VYVPIQTIAKMIVPKLPTINSIPVRLTYEPPIIFQMKSSLRSSPKNHNPIEKRKDANAAIRIDVEKFIFNITTPISNLC